MPLVQYGTFSNYLLEQYYQKISDKQKKAFIWDIDNDKVCISFKNKEINNCLKDYAVDYKKDNILIEKTETNYESTLTRLMLINDKLR